MLFLFNFCLLIFDYLCFCIDLQCNFLSFSFIVGFICYFVVVVVYLFFSNIGLKTVISELPPPSSSLSSNICKRITGRLTDTITKVNIVSLSNYYCLMLSNYVSIGLSSDLAQA